MWKHFAGVNNKHVFEEVLEVLQFSEYSHYMKMDMFSWTYSISVQCPKSFQGLWYVFFFVINFLESVNYTG